MENFKSNDRTFKITHMNFMVILINVQGVNDTAQFIHVKPRVKLSKVTTPTSRNILTIKRRCFRHATVEIFEVTIKASRYNFKATYLFLSDTMTTVIWLRVRYKTAFKSHHSLRVTMPHFAYIRQTPVSLSAVANI